jgi:hypothetical protein
MTTEIVFDRVSCGIRQISVAPYRTTTKFGEAVEVYEFEQDADGSALVSVIGCRIKRNGEPYARPQTLLGVEVPADIAEMLR